MSGFLSSNLNQEFKQNLFEIIVDSLIQFSNMMKDDCLAEGKYLENHEEKIRTHLLENYLNNDDIRRCTRLSSISLRFIPENYENYDRISETYLGRTDIKVVSANWFENNRDYYIIECKRINSKSALNKKYISEGVSRFVVNPPKYSSYHGKNIMFAFIVEKIDIKSAIKKIDIINKKELSNIIDKNLEIINEEGRDDCFLCKSSYFLNSSSIELSHLFYDFSSIIK